MANISRFFWAAATAIILFCVFGLFSFGVNNKNLRKVLAKTLRILFAYVLGYAFLV